MIYTFYIKNQRDGVGWLHKFTLDTDKGIVRFDVNLNSAWQEKDMNDGLAQVKKDGKIWETENFHFTAPVTDPTRNIAEFIAYLIRVGGEKRFILPPELNWDMGWNLFTYVPEEPGVIY